jgi:hypothetical protein
MPLPLLIPSGIKPKQTHFVIKRDDPTPTTRKGKKKKNLTKENSCPHSPAASTYRHQIFPQPQPHFTPESQKNEGKKKMLTLDTIKVSSLLTPGRKQCPKHKRTMQDCASERPDRLLIATRPFSPSSVSGDLGREKGLWRRGRRHVGGVAIIDRNKKRPCRR